MKRILCIFLAMCLMMTVSCAFALTTTLTELDDGTQIVLDHNEAVQALPAASEEEAGMHCWLIDDGVHAPISLVIAFSEIEGELSLGDLTEEEQMQYGELVGEMFANPEIHLDTTPSGNRYLHVCSNEQSDIDTIFTIYKGYFVELIQHKADFSALTEEDQAFCLSVLHGIEFIKAE